MSPRPSRAGSLGVALLGVALAALLAELGLRLLDLAPEAVDVRHGWTVRFDRELLFRLRPSSRPDINRLGYRDREFPRRRSGSLRILVLGDSFTMGWNVEPEATLPSRLGHHLGAGAEVLNLGVLGYGPDQSLLALRRHGPDLEPDLVVLDVYAGNDFEDLAKNRLFSLGPSGELVAQRENPVSRLVPRLRLAVLWRTRVTGSLLRALTDASLSSRLFGDTELEIGPPRAPRTREKVELMAALLERFRRELAEREVGFLVAILPSLCAVARDGGCRPDTRIRPGYTGNEDALDAICHRRALACVNLLRPFGEHRPDPRELYAPGDYHFSALGNDLAARIVAGALFRHHSDRMAALRPGAAANSEPGAP